MARIRTMRSPPAALGRDWLLRVPTDEPESRIVTTISTAPLLNFLGYYRGYLAASSSKLNICLKVAPPVYEAMAQALRVAARQRTIDDIFFHTQNIASLLPCPRHIRYLRAAFHRVQSRQGLRYDPSWAPSWPPFGLQRITPTVLLT